ncbi:glucose-methanol-choline (GMC) oxidoreductase:NAD binding site [Hydrogenimonas sp.]|nr:glucose-methanol-choline (GMC) oxidoreductase:NAD binding site [Hydrogenimonas sp.]
MYDAAIIGSGAAGGTVAYILAKAGMRVALIEKGPWMKREDFSKDEIAYCRRDIVTPNLFEEYHVIERKEGGEWKGKPTYETGWSFWNGNIVGGSSNLMSGMFHRMHPDDFRLLSRYGPIEGANIVDWPISYEELEPYYDKIEELVGISGTFREHPFEPPRRRESLFQPATLENRITKLFDERCRAAGVNPLVTPRAILSRPIEGREACYYSNFCGSYGCSSGAKGSSREAFIMPALKTGNLTLISGTFVKKLVTSSKDRVEYADAVDTETGRSKKIRARIFIVAAQAHETVRLLFNSANRHYPDGLANSSGELGKNLIFSAGGSGEGDLDRKSLTKEMFEELMRPGLFVNRSILDWYRLEDGEKSMKGGLVEFMFGHQNFIRRAAMSKYSKEGRLLWGRDLEKVLRYRFEESKRFRFEVFNDWLPTDECRITVDPTRKDRFGMPVGRLRLNAHPHDLEVASMISAKAEALLRKMGARNIVTDISSLPPQNLIAGGCRFGDDPERSVLNRYCQSHDIPNLFVADASFMPTGGSVPYTWTIYANAMRVAYHIVGVGHCY